MSETPLTPLGSGRCVSSSRNCTREEQRLGSGSGPGAGFGPAAVLSGLRDPKVPRRRPVRWPVAEGKPYQRPPHGVRGPKQAPLSTAESLMVPSPRSPPPPGRLPRPTANPPRRESAKPHGHAAPPLHRGWPGQAGALLRTEPGRDRGGGGRNRGAVLGAAHPETGCVCVWGGGRLRDASAEAPPPFPRALLPRALPHE